MSLALAPATGGATPPIETRAWTRGERTALGVAVSAHVVLFTLLSMATGPQPPRLWPKSQPIEVSLVEDVAPEATAPPAPEPPAPSVAPEMGEPEEAAPAPPPEPVAKPEPVKPAPAKPAPAKPAPAKPEPARPVPKPASAPRPVPASKPAPAKPAPAKATPAAKPPATARSAAAARPTARPSRLTGLASSLAAGAKADATAQRQRGHRMGADLLAGLSPDAPAKKASAAAPGRAGPFPAASISGAIARQIQPCADRQVNPGPGANQIVTVLNIHLNKDGTLAATPRMKKQSGIDDSNERYAQRVVDLGIAAFKGCTPLRLPAEYYATPTGGWSEINYNWRVK